MLARRNDAPGQRAGPVRPTFRHHLAAAHLAGLRAGCADEGVPITLGTDWAGGPNDRPRNHRVTVHSDGVLLRCATRPTHHLVLPVPTRTQIWC
ncbi:hypothetical protein GCM10022225_72510 [Plantactinospora mayteni]|uniref:Uncharacterized protein n=1 Tax=Plantactinospora mayteni TaxID=566021 RepID=A0ABQ4F1B3_9ACTN|nr:hypothetical protein Pma05_72780 [Plantactinospora mayteni]